MAESLEPAVKEEPRGVCLKRGPGMSKKERSCTKFSDRCRAGEGGTGVHTWVRTLPNLSKPVSHTGRAGGCQVCSANGVLIVKGPGHLKVQCPYLGPQGQWHLIKWHLSPVLCLQN